MNIHVLYDDRENINAFWLYNSYFNLFKITDFKVIKFTSLEQITRGDVLVIIDDHYQPNRNVWFNDSFINKLNQLDTKVIVITIEKIYNSYFPITIDLKQKLDKINNLLHISSDAEDSRIFNKKPAKQLFSKVFMRNNFEIIENFEDKKEKILFVGQLNNINNAPCYSRRKQIFADLHKKGLGRYVDFLDSSPDRSFKEYLKLISQYKFILNPLGIGDFLSMRYAEAIFCNSIPIQQYTNTMLDGYSEITDDKGIFFKNSEDLEEIINNLSFYTDKYSKLNGLNIEYLEDYYVENNILEIV